jgi:hypothetical protein
MKYHIIAVGLMGDTLERCFVDEEDAEYFKTLWERDGYVVTIIQL